MAKQKYVSTEEEKQEALAHWERTNRVMNHEEIKEWIESHLGESFIRGVSIAKNGMSCTVIARTEDGEKEMRISLPRVKA